MMRDEFSPQIEDFLRIYKERKAKRDNAEQPVLDAIDELVNEELTHTPDDYHLNNQRYVKCELCHGLWHGLPAHNGCPGAYATAEQSRAWVERSTSTGEYLGFVTTEYQGVLCSVHLYRDEHGGFTGLLMPRDATDEPEHGRGFDCDLYTFDEPLSTFTVEGVALPITYEPQGFTNRILGLDTP